MVRRKMLLSVVVVGMFGSAALAIAPMGPPMAGVPQGQYSGGFGYAYSDMNLEVSGPVSPTGGAAVINDIQSNIYYGCLAYGVSDAWTIYGAAGAADAEFPGDGTSPDFDGDTKFGFAIGCKRTIATDEESGTTWGTVFQFSECRSEDTVRPTSSGQTYGNGAISIPGSSGSRVPVTLDWYEIQLAAGPTIPLCEGCSLYGGPFLHFVEGDLELKGSRNEYELEQHLELGGYIGALIELGGPDVTVAGEFLWTGEAWGLGVGAMILIP